jgi:formylglycine-generating enzyme required for sulfatase activity
MKNASYEYLPGDLVKMPLRFCAKKHRLVGLSLCLAMIHLAPALGQSSNADSGARSSVTRVRSADDMVEVHIPAGEFVMGATSHSEAGDNEKPRHVVDLDAYWIDRTPVTNAMFARFANATSYITEAEAAGSSHAYSPAAQDWIEARGADWRHPQGPSSDIKAIADHPVVQVTWGDAAAYCKWANAQLPTEAEWEKAARGTDEREFPWGNGEVSGDRVNFADRNLKVSWANTKVDDGFAFTSPVGNYPAGASPYGVLDMAGNVWEWLADWYDASYYLNSPKRNPAGPAKGEFRAARGGSWAGAVGDLRSWHRGWGPPKIHADGQGFRCAH